MKRLFINTLFGILLLPSQVLAEDFQLKDLEVFSKSGVRVFTSSSGNTTHKDLYAIPNTRTNKDWQVTQLGESQDGRVPVQFCQNGADCFSGWVSSKWTRPTGHEAKPLIDIGNSGSHTKPNKIVDASEEQKENSPTCLGVIQTQQSGLALRSVNKHEGRYSEGEPLNCGMNRGVNLCIVGANNSTGKRSWAEALINPRNFEKLSEGCQKSLEKAAQDGLISKNEFDEYVVSIFTNSKYVKPSDEEGPDSYSQSTQTEAISELDCAECTQTPEDLNNTTEIAEAILNITTSQPRESNHPEGWPISADGFSYPIAPNKAYITSKFGVRRLHGRLDFHEGIDFGTLGTIRNFHAMKGGRVIKTYMGCGANSGEGCNGGYGNQVYVEHEDGTTMLYNHLHANCKVRVKKGQDVGIGEKLGCIGYSGAGPTHLDVRLLKKDGDQSKTHVEEFPIEGSKKMASLTVKTDFIPIEPKLQAVYAHFLKKQDFETTEALIAALQKQMNVIDENEGNVL